MVSMKMFKIVSTKRNILALSVSIIYTVYVSGSHYCTMYSIRVYIQYMHQAVIIVHCTVYSIRVYIEYMYQAVIIVHCTMYSIRVYIQNMYQAVIIVQYTSIYTVYVLVSGSHYCTVYEYIYSICIRQSLLYSIRVYI